MPAVVSLARICDRFPPDRRRGGMVVARVREAEVAVALRAVAARDRDVELRIAPHAVLVDVEALRLDLRLDTDSPEPVQNPQASVRGAEREHADAGEAEGLHLQLLARAGIDE